MIGDPRLMDQWTLIELLSVGTIILLVLLVASALAKTTERMFEALRVRLNGPPEPRFTLRCMRLLSASITSFVLLIATYAHPWRELPFLLLAASLGLSVATTLYRLQRLLGVGKPIGFLFAAVAFVAAFAGLLGGLDPLITALERASFSIGKYEVSALDIVSGTLVAAALFAGVRLTIRLVNRSIQDSSSLDPLQRVLVQKLAGIVIVVIAVFFGIDLLGIDLTSLAIFSGALGLAVGFGLQKTLGNLIAGLILLMDRSIKPGDIIAVGDSFGWVNKIGIRAVSVITRDGKEHLIPNENLMTQQVENWSFSNRDVRIHVSVGVSFDSDIHRARELMLEAAKASPRVLTTPEPVVWLKEIGESAVVFDLRVWVSDPEAGIGNVRGDILLRIWDLFKANGVRFPYPQRDIHIRTFPDALKPAVE